MQGRKVQARAPAKLCNRHLPLSAAVQCEEPAALGTSLRTKRPGTSPRPHCPPLPCWVVPSPKTSSPASWPARLRRLHSKVRLRRVQYAPCYSSLRSGRASKVRLRRVHPRLPLLQGLRVFAIRKCQAAFEHQSCSAASTLAGSASQTLPGSRGTALTGCWRSVCSPSSRREGFPVAHPARSARINVVAECFYSTVPACSRAPSSLAPPSHRAHSFEPSRLRRVRPSAFRTGCRSLSASGSLRSPIRRPAKARHHPTLPDRLPCHRSTSFRALWHFRTLRCRKGGIPSHQGQCAGT